MCGIVGFLSRDGASSLHCTLLRRMLSAVRHRGPDEFGMYLYGHERFRAGLGNARLSIIDLEHGQQPISNEDGTLWIAFNGEIYNYVELRRELESLGHRFSSTSDTEVLIHLFEQFGPDGVNRLNGQFAFAIWDEKSEQLFLARDRCGVRPLFYVKQGDTLVFASEIKAILAHGAVRADLDPVALDQIFTFWSPLAPRTAFQGIHSLPPGCWLLASRSGDIRVNRYWELKFPAAGDEPYQNAEETADRLSELLNDAVRLRLRADVPVGAYLSGGLDSSIIASIIRRAGEGRLETFSIAFADAAFDESEFQLMVARRLGTRHHVVNCTHNDIGRVFPEVIWHTELPILRTAPAPLYLLSELVQREGFKVVLTGEGADEFLAGYDIFKEAKIRRFWSRQPESNGRPALLKKLYQDIGALNAANMAYRRNFFGRNLVDAHRAEYSHSIRWKNTGRTKRLFSAGLRDALEKSPGRSPDSVAAGDWTPDDLNLPHDFSRWSPLARAQYLEATIFMSEYLLSSQGDRMAMAHSVEGRFPFLDHRVVEYCNMLAPRLKLHGLKEKHLLKRIARDMVPEAVWRRPKRPYRAPIQRCFFPEGKPLAWVADAVAESSLASAGCFDPSVVKLLVQKAQRSNSLGEVDGMALAGVLSTQILHQRFVACFSPPPVLDEKENVKTVFHYRPDTAEGNVAREPE
jgi:asparagine synthase (glutamine-hydrolysing)